MLNSTRDVQQQLDDLAMQTMVLNIPTPPECNYMLKSFPKFPNPTSQVTKGHGPWRIVAKHPMNGHKPKSLVSVGESHRTSWTQLPVPRCLGQHQGKFQGTCITPSFAAKVSVKSSPQRQGKWKTQGPSSKLQISSPQWQGKGTPGPQNTKRSSPQWARLGPQHPRSFNLQAPSGHGRGKPKYPRSLIGTPIRVFTVPAPSGQGRGPRDPSRQLQDEAPRGLGRGKPKLYLTPNPSLPRLGLGILDPTVLENLSPPVTSFGEKNGEKLEAVEKKWCRPPASKRTKKYGLVGKTFPPATSQLIRGGIQPPWRYPPKTSTHPKPRARPAASRKKFAGP